MRLYRFAMVLCGVMLVACRATDLGYCGNPPQATVDEIVTWNVYKETTIVKLGSFVYDIETGGHLPKSGDRVDLTGFRELKTLSDAEAKNVMGVLVNYDFSANPKDMPQDVFMCYNPRNAILFLDDKEDVIGYVEICFECHGFERYPASLRVGTFCDAKFEMMKAIFRRNSVHYGIFGEDDSLVHETKEMISKARNYIDHKKFGQANEELAKVIQVDSTNAYAHFLMGHCLFRMREYKGARQVFNKVLSLDPGFMQAYYERALATIELSDNPPDQDLLVAICNDLRMVQSAGDKSVLKLVAKYCE